MNIWVIDKEGTPLRRIVARVGLKTNWGRIVRMTPKGFWTEKNGSEWLHREYDGRLPCVYQSYAKREKTA